jgi:hypothetical protein
MNLKMVNSNSPKNRELNKTGRQVNTLGKKSIEKRKRKDYPK